MQSEEDVFTVPELANYLRMKPITIYKHVAGGKLPGFKVGSQWRFKKRTIDNWIEEQEKTNLRIRAHKKN
ncbi:MAG: helix-turn-helix domain-containing protein [Candidatus Omnitrophica bacterium]|nr:helix-turn-helix domain-containing protein [Candidatus Omnitrophota bacterium]